MEYLGEPPDYIKLSSKKKEMFFMDNLHSIKKENSRGKVRMPNTKKLEDFLESAEVEFIDLIKVIDLFIRNVLSGIHSKG